MEVIGKTKVYRKDFDGKPSYSRSISSREYVDGQQGDWITVYEVLQMPKGTDIPDRSIIDVKKSFEAVYKSKGEKKRKVVVQEFEVLDEGHSGFTQLKNDDIPF